MNSKGHGLKMALVFTSLILCFVAQASAHFIWVYEEDGKVKVVFGEGLEPDQAQFLSGLSGMKAFTLHDGTFKPVEFEKQVDGDEGWFEATTADLGQLVEVACPYGVFGRGDKQMFLDYSAKYMSLSYGESMLNSGKPSSKLTLDIVPTFTDGKLSAVAYFKGMPAQDVEVQLESVDTDSATLKTDDTGKVSLQTSSRYVIRAKHVVEEAGEVDGKKFSERRYYCTIVLDVAGANDGKTNSETTADSAEESQAVTIALKKVDSKFADFPKGMTSFGATVLDNSVYVIGGKSGKAHSYAKSYQNRNVYRLNLDGSNDEWEVAGDNLGLQGLAIVGHAGKVYRIGGLEARNKEGDDHDLHSIREFLAFDPIKKSWTKLPELPEGRSSFDACVAGNHVFVVGGWTMAGEEDSVWADTVLKFDLSNADSKWEEIEAPFRTRALAVRAHGDQLVVIGGIQETGGPTGAVHFFDLKTNKWSDGPDVPSEGGMKAFGCSAVSLDENLLVSTYDGGIFQLNAGDQDGEKSWSKVHQLEAGRFFHQMLPVGESKFALVGGSHMEHGSHMEVEVYEVVKKAEKKVANAKH
ncbi:MAG: kelch repeat-containing protein [Planctomycetota bacterium]